MTEIQKHEPFKNQTVTWEGKQYDAWQYLLDKVTTELFFGGGVGSGKSLLGCCFEIYMRTKYPETHGLVARNEYTQLEKSTMLRFFEILKATGYRSGRDYTYNDNKHRITWSNGSLTFFQDLQYRPNDRDFHRLGSTEYTNAFIDEAPEITRGAKDVVRERIRYKTKEYNLEPKLLMTGNPGDHWIKKDYVFDDQDNRVTLLPHQKVILATLEDNPDKEFASRYRAYMLQGTDEYRKRRLLYGDWLARPKTGNEFINTFDMKLHTGIFFYQPDLPLHITWDFNLYPYITMLVAQIQHNERNDNYEVYFLKEYTLEKPLNSVISVCDAFLKDLTNGYFAGHDTGIFYYGDYNGLTENNMGIKEARYNYQLMETKLFAHLGNTSKRVIPNPRQAKAKGFMREVFAGTQSFSVYFDQRMSNTIKDILNLKEGIDGGLLKEMYHDTELNIKYEKYGHCTQAMYYLVISAFKAEYDNYERTFK